ncbi:Fibrinogen C domain-containing protein 1 [Branchiostoma belcheri]|nr:Fibrinogen C domain-containing protein 1 [Branchiostoma belcheri]
MASSFPGVLTFLVTCVFLCSAQSVCRPPSDEKCVCNQVVNCGNDDALRAELEKLKIAVEQLSQTRTSGYEGKLSFQVDSLSRSCCILGGSEVRLDSIRFKPSTKAHEGDLMMFANNTDSDKPQDCQDILNYLGTTHSGVYMVYPRDNLGGIKVFCDMDTDGGGWTRRRDGTVDFYRGWADYNTGFPSNLNGEFWLGNYNLYRLAVQKVYQLRVDMEDVEGNTAYAAYDTFTISPESQNYTLHIGTYSGTAGDSLAWHDGKQFSTKDRDNDEYSRSCAQSYKGAWWYNACHHSNLNGLYYLGTQRNDDGVNWHSWQRYSLKRTEMKLRPAP